MNDRNPCPNCEEPRDREVAARRLWIGLAIMAGAWVFLGSNGLREVLAPFIAVYLGAYVSIAAHESARAAAAIMSNREVTGIAIGTIGPSALFDWGTPTKLSVVPNVGVTDIRSDDDDTVSDALILMAGLIVHLGLLALAAWPARSVEAFYDTRTWILGVLAGLLLQLIPRDVDGSPSVGRQLVTYVSRATDKVLESNRQARLERAEKRIRQATAEAEEQKRLEKERREIEAQNTLRLASVPVALTAERSKLLEAGKALEDMMLDDDGPDAPSTAVVRNDLARVLLTLAEEGDCERALKLIESSKDASVAISDTTRGAALVGVGRYDEGFGLLERELKERSDGFASAFHALAAIRLGRLDIARNAAREAYGAGVRIWALREAMPRIGRAEASMLVDGFGCGHKPAEEAAAAVVDTHGDLAGAIGRAARTWIDNATPGDVAMFESELKTEIDKVRACADLLAGAPAESDPDAQNDPVSETV